MRTTHRWTTRTAAAGARGPIGLSLAVALTAAAAGGVLLGIQGHLGHGAIRPWGLVSVAVSAAALAGAALLVVTRRMRPEDLTRLAGPAASTVSAAAWCLMTWMLRTVATGEGSLLIGHVVWVMGVFPASVVAVAAYFLFEDWAQTTREAAPVAAAHPVATGRGPGLRLRITLSLLVFGAVPAALVAATLRHILVDHDPASAVTGHGGVSPHDHRALAQLVAVTSVFFSLAAVGLGALASRSVLRPLWALIRGMDVVRDGPLPPRLAVWSTDELGRATDTFNRMVAGLQERAWLRETFGQYVNRDVADALRAGAITLDGELREVTVLFADIRGFTPIAERMQPAELLEFINAYLARMIDVIAANHGRLDKVMGDGVMVVFGAPLDDPDHPAHAWETAVGMLREVARFNADGRDRGWPAIRIGIGLHTGRVVAGAVGSRAHKLEYTVLGDVVNVAARLEALTKEHGVDVVLSEVVRLRATASSTTASLGEAVLRGRAAPLRIFGATAAGLVGHPTQG